MVRLTCTKMSEYYYCKLISNNAELPDALDIVHRLSEQGIYQKFNCSESELASNKSIFIYKIPLQYMSIFRKTYDKIREDIRKEKRYRKQAK